jgi:SHS2 domain-containing protein
MKFEYLEDEATADLAIRAVGKDLREAFENTALALINAIVDVESVDEQEVKYVTKTAADLKSLLYDFLEEVLFFHDAEGIVFKTIKVQELDEKLNKIKAVFKGEVFNPGKHEARNNIKAITYFGMEINKLSKGYEIKVTVDL